MNNNNLLYIIENENFSAAISDGTFTGIDTTSSEFPYYMEGRIMKSEVLTDELSKGEVPYEYLEIIATSQLNQIESEDLISKIKNHDLSMEEVFKLVETHDDEKVRHAQNESANDNTKKLDTLTREDLMTLAAETDLKDTDIIDDLSAEEQKQLNREEERHKGDPEIVLG